MTADTFPLRIPAGMHRTARLQVVRRVGELQVDEAITPEDAAARIARLTAHNTALTAEARNEAHEQLIDALTRLDHIHSDIWDPAEGDRQHLAELAADDAEQAVLTLVGRRSQ